MCVGVYALTPLTVFVLRAHGIFAGPTGAPADVAVLVHEGFHKKRHVLSVLGEGTAGEEGWGAGEERRAL